MVVPAQGFPVTGTPLMDNDGNLSLVWLRFFISLWTRTGGSVAVGQTTVLGLTGMVTLPELISGGLAPLNSPAFTGTPTAPQPASSSNSDQLATTGFVLSHSIKSIPTPPPDPGANPVIPLTAGTSPFTYNPPMSGNLLVSGGTVTAITLTRGSGNLGHAISDISLSQTQFAPNAPIGTKVASITVTSSNVGAITLSLSGPDAADFKIVGTDLLTNKVNPAGTYDITVTATAPLVLSGTAYNVGVTAGSIRLTDFDLVTVTFSTAPSLAFFPS